MGTCPALFGLGVVTQLKLINANCAEYFKKGSRGISFMYCRCRLGGKYRVFKKYVQENASQNSSAYNNENLSMNLKQKLLTIEINAPGKKYTQYIILFN